MTEHKTRSSRRAQGGHLQSQGLSPGHEALSPSGIPMTIDDLPPPGTGRWVIRRKAEVVAAVRGGLLSLDDALARYRLTAEEFLAWQKAIDKWGMQGLRTTRIQHYRN